MGVNLQVVNDTGSGDLPDLSHLDKPMEQDDPAPPSKPQEKKKEKEEAMEVEQSENQKKVPVVDIRRSNSVWKSRTHSDALLLALSSAAATASLNAWWRGMSKD